LLTNNSKITFEYSQFKHVRKNCSRDIWRCDKIRRIL